MEHRGNRYGRSEQARQSVLRAADDLLVERGFAQLTMEGIAARAGVAKQTIYRWWPSKADVLLDALATKADLFVPIPDEGSLAADLRGFLTTSFALAGKKPLADALRALMAQAQLDEEFRGRFWSAFLRRRRDALGVLLDRATARGELPMSREACADVVFGVVWYRLLTDRPLDDRLADELVTLLCGRTTS